MLKEEKHEGNLVQKTQEIKGKENSRNNADGPHRDHNCPFNSCSE